MANNEYYKKRNILIDFEDLIKDQWYAITINPCDKYQHFKVLNRIGTCLEDLNKVFMFYKGIDYEMYPELSSKGRFHWHGKIKIKDKVHFYTTIIPYLISKCTITLKEIGKEEDWEDYCTKQKEFHDYIEIMHYTNVPVCRT